MTDAILTGAVLAAMAAIAVHDARRALVDPRMVLALLGAAAAWRFLGSAGNEPGGAWPRLVSGVLGASLGVAAAMVPIAVAQWCGKRWPLYPGDAMMLGAFGFLLGVTGLAWTMLLGSGFALVHRFCVQKRRGRPFRKGLVPLGPGMCAGAAAVFLCMNFGVALAEDTGAGDTRAEDTRAADPRAVDPRAVDVRDVTAAPLPAVWAAGETPPLAATELGPALAALPPALAAREVSVDGGESLPFPALVRRISSLSGVAMRIEERPARIAGGAAVLADPPPLRPVWQGPFAGLLDRVTRLSGYDWSWETLVPETLVPEDGAVVFFRYWDAAQRGPAAGAGIEKMGTQEGAGDEPAAGAPDAGEEYWTVDPEKHGTLQGVLESWAAGTGWTLVWNAERDYGLGAAARFEGGFLEAVDLLLSGPATRVLLDVHAYPANRHLVVDDAEGAGW